MKKIINSSLELLLDIYRKNGGVVDYLLVASQNKISNFSKHKEVGLYAMSQWEKDVWPEKIKTQKIYVDKFIGRLFDRENKKILKHQFDLGAGGADEGYAYAFFFPPYTIRIEEKDLLILFEQINTILFNNFHDDLDIYKWSVDWSNYFKPGNEWWGSFFWTILNKDKNIYIVIAASTTD